MVGGGLHIKSVRLRGNRLERWGLCTGRLSLKVTNLQRYQYTVLMCAGSGRGNGLCRSDRTRSWVLLPIPLELCIGSCTKRQLGRDFQADQCHGSHLFGRSIRKVFRRGAKTRSSLTSTLGWCDRFTFLGYFTARTHVVDFPVDNESDKEIQLDAIGVLGLKFMRLGFDSTYVDGTADFQCLLKTKMWTELENSITLKADREGKTTPDCTTMPPKARCR